MLAKSFCAYLLVLLLAAAPAFGAEKSGNERVVKDGLMISLDYTLKSSDGKVIETNKGRAPLRYIHGQKMMIPGLEKELTGMKVGGEKHVTVQPEDAYGKIKPNALREIPKEQVPADALKQGAVLATREPDGSIKPMTVKQIKEKTVVMDMNHPMAGKTLVFDVKIVDIQPPPPPPSAQPPKAAPSAKSAPPAKAAEPANK